MIRPFEKHIACFEAIGLGEMDEVSFLRRSDTKYVFHISKLEKFLSLLCEKYKVLEIDGKRVQEYETHYFDTPGFDMFRLHHNGKRDRFKVRTRQYVNSGIFFLEVKKKDNKGITSKRRISIQSLDLDVNTSLHANYVDKRSPFDLKDLELAVNNQFKRITLVDTKTPERLTLDWDLRFTEPTSGEQKKMENICIAEVKKERGSKNPWFDEAVKSCSIYPLGFSKYCIGLLQFNNSVKSNRFKPRLLQLHKMKLIT
ncbi:MAG: polyphosphate polymerase domain-containing protein [Bacteroidales bacterium]|nr:polyphosphate polymerase domain-containing protein [Bacteroidales bacterium]MCF8456834.1 polyphosphate polymerase domain-containing protein [Bacteroidales bacterium]